MVTINKKYGAPIAKSLPPTTKSRSADSRGNFRNTQTTVQAAPPSNHRRCARVVATQSSNFIGRAPCAGRH